MAQAVDPSEVARSIIDRDIARLEESIRALKSRRNELSPISRLPDEILCKIFSLSLSLSIFRSPKFWTNFSQLSQRWTSSALSAPELWTNIPLNYPRWAQEMLIRSKRAKLTFRYDCYNSNSKTLTARSCLYEINRVEEIDITTDSKLILEEIFRDLPNKSAPQLHTLRIHRACGTALSIHEDFLYDTERLQRVELINYSIPDDSGGLSTYPVVDLPCLRFLRISSGVGALPVTTVLRHITFPHSAILGLTCKENQSTQIDFPNLFSVLATKFLSFLVIRSLSLQDSHDHNTQGLKFCLGTDAIIPDCCTYSAEFQLQLLLTWPSSQPHNHAKALTCAFDAMSLPFLTQFQIIALDYYTHFDSMTWVKTFGKLPLLERVYVRGYAARSAAHSFLEALVYKTKAAEKSETAYRDVSFPKLRYIHLEGTDFINSISVDMLLDCLMERCERNAEIQLLRLEDCYDISSDDVERLKEIVVDVMWDGIEQLLTPRLGRRR